MSTSGTTGDPTLVPEKWGGGGPARRSSPATSGAWACGPATTSRSCCSPSAGRRTGCSRASARSRSCSTSTRRRWSASASCRSATGPTGLYNFGSVLINAVREVCERRGFDPRDVFASYKGVVFAGEPLSPRARALAESWGVELFEHTGVGDVTAAFECHAHDGLHVWEDTVLVEGLDPDGTRTGRRRRTLRARRHVVVQPHRAARPLPLRRHRAPRPRRRARAAAPTRACGRSAARATRSSSTAGRCCRSTCGPRSSRSTRARWGCSR